MTDFIPVSEPLIAGKEKDYLLECLETGWISSEGQFVREFEERFAERVGRRYGIAVCNGSAALEVAVAAVGLGPGDEVILPTFTIISCVAAILRAGAQPVLVDSDPCTWNMDTSKIEEVITPRTKAIMVVHIYGLPTDMAAILAIADRHGLIIIEDAAEMIGQTYNDKPCGSFGEVSTFSFYPNKHVTTGEGGMVLTNDEHLAERCRAFRNLCFQTERRFVHEELGWNFRMSNLHAALGLAQLEQLDCHIKRKRWMGSQYRKRLSAVQGLKLPLAECDYAENIYWVFGIQIEDDVTVDANHVMRELRSRGIGSRPFFWCMHEQPVFFRMGLFKEQRHPVAETMARRGLYLPSSATLTEAQIDRVAKAVSEIMS